MFVFISDVNGAEHPFSTDDIHCPGGTCIPMCAWKNTNKKKDMEIVYYYDIFEEKFYVQRVGGDGQAYYSELTNDIGRHDFGAGVAASIDSGTCPPYAYSDVSFYKPDGVCISVDGTCTEGNFGKWYDKREYGGETSLIYDVVTGGMTTDFNKYLNELGDMNLISLQKHIENTKFNLAHFGEVVLKIPEGAKIPKMMTNKLLEYSEQYEAKVKEVINKRIDASINSVKSQLEDDLITAEMAEMEIARLEELREQLLIGAAVSAAHVNDAQLNEAIKTFGLTCEYLLSADLNALIVKIYNFMRFLVPLIILVMSIIDFIKAIAGHDQDLIKKATAKLIKRMVIAILFFLVPTILKEFLSLIDDTYSSCL